MLHKMTILNALRSKSWHKELHVRPLALKGTAQNRVWWKAAVEALREE